MEEVLQFFPTSLSVLQLGLGRDKCKEFVTMVITQFISALYADGGFLVGIHLQTVLIVESLLSTVRSICIGSSTVQPKHVEHVVILISLIYAIKKSTSLS